MPTIKDKLTGKKVANLPYNAQGEQTAQKMVQQNPSLEIDYGQNNVTDASGMRETYHLGGEVPGDPGFGQNPMGGFAGSGTNINPPLTEIEANPPLPEIQEPFGIYKKGGKVGSKTKGVSKQPKKKYSYKAIQEKHKKKKAKRKKVEKYMGISGGVKE